MDRMLDYTVQINEDGLRVEQFLRRRGYSRQNLVELKKMPLSILVNGSPRRLNEILTDMDTLTVHIQEHVSSLQIPPVHLPLDIIYEDEDIIVINKPAGMPVHPSINNYTNTLANGLAWYYREAYAQL